MKRPNLISVSAAGVLRLAGFSLMFALLLAPWFQGLLFELAGGAFLLLSVTAARQPVLAVITGSPAFSSLLYAAYRYIGL